MISMKSKELQVLQVLMQSDFHCPNSLLFPVRERQLFRLAVKNKIAGILMHFLSCKQCNKLVSNNFLRMIEMHEVRKLGYGYYKLQEKKKIIQWLKKNKRFGVFFKEKQSDSCLNNLYGGADIDILVNSETSIALAHYFARHGYTRYSYPPKENTFIHPQTHVAIDVHTILFFPHYGILTRDDEIFVHRLTQDILNSSNRNKKGAFYLDNEMYLFVHVMGFWTNDLAKGLGSIYKFGLYSLKYMHAVNWEKFYKLIIKYKRQNKTVFVIHLMHRLLGFPLTPGINMLRAPFWVRLLSCGMNIEDIAEYPSILKWHGRYKQYAAAYHSKFSLLSFCLSDDVIFLRLIRPRILVLLFYAAIQRSKKLWD